MGKEKVSSLARTHTLSLLLSPAMHRTWLFISAVTLLVSMGCVAYAVIFLPGLQADNWREKAPVLIITATVGGVIGGIW